MTEPTIDLTALAAVYRKSAQQQLLANYGLAEGQCQDCGSHRHDGKPPSLHEPGCPHAHDWLDAIGRAVS